MSVDSVVKPYNFVILKGEVFSMIFFSVPNHITVFCNVVFYFPFAKALVVSQVSIDYVIFCFQFPEGESSLKSNPTMCEEILLTKRKHYPINPIYTLIQVSNLIISHTFEFLLVHMTVITKFCHQDKLFYTFQYRNLIKWLLFKHGLYNSIMRGKVFFISDYISWLNVIWLLIYIKLNLQKWNFLKFKTFYHFTYAVAAYFDVFYLLCFDRFLVRT